ncbi:MAG TPA: SDR family NAD(P)-dependent oxidoreductase [Steroidobacteraceae bacterium]|jgi:NAD(P)-dependent dehydrogenase (short-subunit alcohol dehydrogenase family)
MTSQRKTVVVTGASQGIGAGVANLFLERGYNVVANSRRIGKQHELQSSERLALVDGDIALAGTADRIVAAALERFGAIDALVNNAGIFFTKPFTEYTVEDFRALSATNLEGFLHLSQRVIRQLLAQQRGGSVVNITASIADHPRAHLTATVPMITKGGLNAVTRSLALEYAKQRIRVNAVAPGAIATPLVNDAPQDFLESLSPMGQIGTSRDIAEAVLYLTEASNVTGVVLNVDGGLHL